MKEAGAACHSLVSLACVGQRILGDEGYYKGTTRVHIGALISRIGY